jgi:DNA (cytosine-5)-methyltransferase 1
MSKPRLLDLFSGAGGCTKGYQRAGFYVVGVDIEDQPNYCGDEFYRVDALAVLREWTSPGLYDAIHASPPCQDYSRAMRHLSAPQPRLIEPVRDLLAEAGLPWVIENVPGSPLPTSSNLLGEHGVELCGSMFGKAYRRHRLFETSFPISPPAECDHSLPAMNPHNQAGRNRITADHGPGDQERPWREEMGVEWMGRYEAREAIPPAYTEWIGHHLMARLTEREADEQEERWGRGRENAEKAA